MRRFPFALSLVLVVLSTNAFAQDGRGDRERPSHDTRPVTTSASNQVPQSYPENAWLRNRFAVELHLAPTGSPVSVVGLVMDYSVLKYLSLFGGGGASPVGAGVQGAFGLRLRVPVDDNWALGYATSISGGAFETFRMETGNGGVDRSDFALWSNHELSIEYRSDSGFLVRLFVGMSYLLNPGNFYYHSDYGGKDEKRVPSDSRLPNVGVAVGHAF